LHDYFLSLILGIIEGLTEFLPVSSTAHLRIAEQLFDLPLKTPYWHMYTVVIQLGAVLCLPVYFWRRIVQFLQDFPRGRNGDRTWLTHPVTLTLIAFVVTAGPSFLLTKKIGEHLDNFFVMGGALLIGGAVMWGVDVLFTTARVAAMDEMTLPQAIWIGACQILSAVFPGTSRSMSTIAAGQLAGMSRSAALEFSFFLSIPTMVAATGYDLLKSLRGRGENPIGVSEISRHGWLLLLIGLIVSFVVAYASVAWLMAYVRRRGFAPFAIYRIVVGLLVLLLLA
jgi:undecaprenyl-diphosphatase